MTSYGLNMLSAFWITTKMTQNAVWSKIFLTREPSGLRSILRDWCATKHTWENPEPHHPYQGSRPGKPCASKTQLLNLAGIRVTWQASVEAGLQRSFWWPQICSDLLAVGKALSLFLRSNYFNLIPSLYNTEKWVISQQQKHIMRCPGSARCKLHLPG